MAARSIWFEPRRGAAALRLACIAAAAATFASGAIAQTYPVKPIRLVVPYAPGGGVDIIARATAQELAKRLGQQIIVDNRTGAGGNIGSDTVAKAPPDGYTLLMASPANTINSSLYTNMPYDPLRDLIPVALIGSVPSVMVANPSLPVRDIKQLIALAKANPGALTYGSGGSGTTEHLAGEMFKSFAGVDLLHVPYKGGAQVMIDLMGGQVALMFSNQLGVLPHIKAGKLKALGVASAGRSTALPDVPTFAEAGFSDFKVSVWWGVMGPAAMPKEIVTQLNREIVAGLVSPEMKERLQTMSAQPIGGTPEQFAVFFAAETKRWAPIVKASGAKAD
ncbi:MAG: tripartite tricarboxylate transporter substrate binding protein [Betaproteobacteria bacterium]|nr:tripartite tricarboxylate transporter substrate binding protein [Betaproteobacteria bacterium]